MFDDRAHDIYDVLIDLTNGSGDKLCDALLCNMDESEFRDSIFALSFPV